MSKKDPRKIVLILGNGFDLDLDLKTSYKNFWESDFCPKQYPAPLINHLNQRWANNREGVKWYDLENELLTYYQNEVKKGTRRDVISIQENNLLRAIRSDYLPMNVEAKYVDPAQSLLDKGYIIYAKNDIGAHYFSIPYYQDMLQSVEWRDRRALELIKEGLCKYIQSIDQYYCPESTKVASEVLLAMSKSVKAGDYVDIFSFNYTKVQRGGHEIQGIPVHYMHGCCKDGRIIVGTRDDSTIENDYDFLMKVMDDAFNPPDIVNALKEADEVIVFGHSLGLNDSQYFAPFFLRQSDYYNQSKKEIIIFTRDSNSRVEIKRALQKMTGGKLSVLYSINQPIIIRTGNLKDDQKLMFDFLINHHTGSDYAAGVIGKLIAQ